MDLTVSYYQHNVVDRGIASRLNVVNRLSHYVGEESGTIQLNTL